MMTAWSVIEVRMKRLEGYLGGHLLSLTSFSCGAIWFIGDSQINCRLHTRRSRRLRKIFEILGAGHIFKQ